MSKQENASGAEIVSSPLLAALGRTIRALRSGDHFAWGGDDYLALMEMLKAARADLNAMRGELERLLEVVCEQDHESISRILANKGSSVSGPASGTE